jgi:hypothetical protein
MKILILMILSFGIFADTVSFSGSYHKTKDGCVYHGKNPMNVKIEVHSKKTCPNNKKSPRMNEIFICEVKNKNNQFFGDCQESD